MPNADWWAKVVAQRAAFKIDDTNDQIVGAAEEMRLPHGLYSREELTALLHRLAADHPTLGIVASMRSDDFSGAPGEVHVTIQRGRPAAQGEGEKPEPLSLSFLLDRWPLADYGPAHCVFSDGNRCSPQ